MCLCLTPRSPQMTAWFFISVFIRSPKSTHTPSPLKPFSPASLITYVSCFLFHHSPLFFTFSPFFCLDYNILGHEFELCGQPSGRMDRKTFLSLRLTTLSRLCKRDVQRTCPHPLYLVPLPPRASSSILTVTVNAVAAGKPLSG